MFKRIIAIALCLLLVLSFAACKKDKADGSSTDITSSDATQDFDQDIWDEGSLTEEEKEELEELWNDLKENSNAEIVGSSSTDSTSSTGSSSSANSSSQESSSAESSSSGSSSTPSNTTSSTVSSSSELAGSISVGNSGIIW